jgi:lipopolysaccharide cholinephosphotransferase
MRELTQGELRGVQLSILDKVDDFCNNHGIIYHLAFGSLLGAVRYGTYIPWDDDIDLTMPRGHYAEFCRLFSTVVPELELGAPEITGGWPFPFAKVSDRRTCLVEDTELIHNLGVNIDIFPVDNCAPTAFGRRRHLSRMHLLKTLLTMKGLTPRKGRSGLKEHILRASKPALRRIPEGLLAQDAARTAARHYQESERVSVFVGPYFWDVSEAAMASVSEISFEGRKVPAPARTSEVLEAIYGADYMTPPPVGKRATHHAFKAYWAD